LQQFHWNRAEVLIVLVKRQDGAPRIAIVIIEAQRRHLEL